MGPVDFHSKFIGRSDNEKRGNKRQNNLIDLDPDTTIGVDFSTVAYRFLKNSIASSVIDIEPKVP